MEPVYDLWSEITQKTKQLDICIKELRKSGTAYAEAERDYKIKLREECLRMRAEGMAIGLITMVAYGIEDVAELRFKRDIARTVYEANKDAVNAIKLEIRIINDQLMREYGRPPSDM